jgi:putative ABC transport system ATP-binding protein
MLDQQHDAATAVAPAVALRGVRKVYGEGELAVRALDRVDLEIGAGELVVVLGPSGSGKTTLLNVIGAIEPASGGSVLSPGAISARWMRKGRTTLRRQSLGFVFQFFNLIPTLTALENVELIAELAGRSGGAHAGALLAEVGLGDRVITSRAAVGRRAAAGRCCARARR